MELKLNKSFQSHRNLSVPKKFKSKAGVKAKNEKDNAKFLNSITTPSSIARSR
jgi:hypothetical protein